MLGYITIALKDNEKFREMVKKGEVPDAVVKKWPVYVREWTRWNHVRTVAALASAATAMSYLSHELLHR